MGWILSFPNSIHFGCIGLLLWLLFSDVIVILRRYILVFQKETTKNTSFVGINYRSFLHLCNPTGKFIVSVPYAAEEVIIEVHIRFIDNLMNSTKFCTTVSIGGVSMFIVAVNFSSIRLRYSLWLLSWSTLGLNSSICQKTSFFIVSQAGHQPVICLAVHSSIFTSIT